MRIPAIRELASRRELSSPRYLSRALCFLLRSRFQQKFSATIAGSSYWLQANREKLGVDGYLYVYRDDYEPAIRDCLLQYFQDGWLFIDIGANSGYWSRFIAHHFNESRIIAFEPAKSTFERLCQNLAQYSNCVRTRNAAVSDMEQLSYLEGESDPGSNHLVSEQNSATEQVSAVTLDNELKRDNLLTQCTGQCLIKIDVEGFELHTLRGAKNFLLTSRPIVVFELLERHLVRAQSTPHELFTFWKNLGYSIFSLAHDGKSVRYIKTMSVSNMMQHQGNFIAIYG
jgi:FkbM family methyltransferase